MPDPSRSNEDARRELDRFVDNTTGRADLEVIRDALTQRLHRCSQDLDATYGLSLVTSKLRKTPFAPPVVSASS